MSLARRTACEALGSAFLLMAVVGSGIMGEKLSGGNVGVALLANSIATGGALFALILTFGPVSGSHLNPAVTLALALRREFAWPEVAPYAVAQVGGAALGVVATHAMFDLPLIQQSAKVRAGPPLLGSELIATFGLVTVILWVSRWRRDAVPQAVAAYVTAGYWFTASTCFANPAVTLARSLTGTFTGIHASDVPGFIVAQFIAIPAATTCAWLFVPPREERPPDP